MVNDRCHRLTVFIELLVNSFHSAVKLGESILEICVMVSTEDFGSSSRGSSPLSPTMVQILRKEGWELNPKDKLVNSIIKAIERNKGCCPCNNDSEDNYCPCSNYRLEDKCCCGLYLKVRN